MGDGSDPNMIAASIEARLTFKFLWRELSWEHRRIIPGLDMYAVKVRFPVKKRIFSKAPDSEVMWISDLRFDGREISGKLLNQPNWVKGLREGSPVTIPLEELIDWMYGMNGKVYGGYTVQVIRSRMRPEERAAHDSAWGMDFGDPSEVRLAPRPIRKEDGTISTDDTRPVTDVIKLSAAEHPMSINMKSKMVEMMRDHPDLANEPDENGWTLLQREALAGNATPVDVLLKHGADRSLTNPFGETAVDLAKKMYWPKVIELLQK